MNASVVKTAGFCEIDLSTIVDKPQQLITLKLQKCPDPNA